MLQFEFGQSNPSYKLTDSRGQRFVLRKKPPGKLLTRAAHQIEREYRVIRALNGTDIPVPKVYCLCEDSSVIGTPFYIMEFLDGRIFQDAWMPGVSADERNAMWKQAVQTLARLHRLDPASIGLADFGKPRGFYNRQIRTLKSLCESYAKVTDVETNEPVGKIPGTDELVAYFADEGQQPQDRGTLVHGDYKIDNLVFHKTKPVIIGILDWEISTVGHPLSDLSNLVLPWTVTQTSKEIKQHSHPAFSLGGGPPGLPTKGQCLEWYREVVGWDPAAEVVWADAFMIFRTSVMLQGIAARHAVRQATGEDSLILGRERFPYARAALRMVRCLKAQRESMTGNTRLERVGRL
ncbi:Phosphotransferase enzyme family domain protein [Cladophialophora carrionii]|uniref:Phosphotransferase enzyme family domain protein n=1 Tax=Cladophialophora carrionii TaxID=86049 RepID=A0A1C1CME2_9EURO|nr:Phosphotransferase enzyme family domain protein [Cladophialophora carrionii]